MTHNEVTERPMIGVHEMLRRMRAHCRDVHGATPDDYRMDVFGWHKRAFRSCDYSVLRDD